MTADTSVLPAWPALPMELDALLVDIEAEGETDPRHPRPWDLAVLSAPLREPTWQWLDDAVRWINICGAWQPDAVIPPCWRRHPHLALELAVLAFGRELAARSPVPDGLRDWHDQLHDFHGHMGDALGENGLKDCQRGRHGDRPSTYELDQYDQHR